MENEFSLAFIDSSIQRKFIGYSFDPANNKEKWKAIESSPFKGLFHAFQQGFLWSIYLFHWQCILSATDSNVVSGNNLLHIPF